MLIDAIDHVQLAMPPSGEPLAIWFYDEVLGVPQRPKPPHLAVRGGCWFERGALRIHLGVQDDFVPATKAHPAFAVVDLERFRQRLTDAGITVRWEEDPMGIPSAYVDDPFGNRLEFGPERPVPELADQVATIAEVASECGGPDLSAQLRFVLELDRLKTVLRQSFVVDGERRENSAEHSWHVALMAVVLADHLDGDPDLGRVVTMLLLHDLVEVDAGDTGIYDTAARATKEDRERAAADRIFDLLPTGSGQELRRLWDEYEEGESVDARAARVLDRLAPFLLNLGSGGLAWRRWGVTASQVREVLGPIGRASESLGGFVEAMVSRAVADGLLPDSALILDTTMPPEPPPGSLRP